MYVFKKLLLTAVGALLSAGCASTALADTTNFNFETLGTTSGGGLSSVVLSQGGLTMTLSRPGSVFDITNLSGLPGVTASWGSRTLDPLANAFNAPVFNANFSQALSNISIEAGDFTPSDLDNLTLVAYDALDGTGNIVGHFIAFCCDVGSGFVFTRLTVSGAGIRSIHFYGGSDGLPNSVYYDNITATVESAAVPEPATIILLGGALLGLAAKGRRRSGSKSQADQF
jgi:PEP-CTERM motif